MSTGLKTLISISTVVLLVLIVAYHMLEIQVCQLPKYISVRMLVKIFDIFSYL